MTGTDESGRGREWANASSRVDLSKALADGKRTWGRTLILDPKTLICDLCADHLELIEAVTTGVDSIDSLAVYCDREYDDVEEQVETLVRTGIVDYDENSRLMIPNETIVGGPLIASQ